MRHESAMLLQIPLCSGTAFLIKSFNQKSVLDVIAIQPSLNCGMIATGNHDYRFTAWSTTGVAIS